jgi:hypothetical protein
MTRVHNGTAVSKNLLTPFEVQRYELIARFESISY